MTTTQMPAAEYEGPASVDAERVVVGAMMLDPAAVTAVTRRLKPASFFDPRHATLYAEILAAADRGEPTDPAAVLARLSPEQIRAIGGAAYLVELTQTVPATVQAGWYADRVAAAALSRDIGKLGVHAQQYARSVDNPRDALVRIQRELDDLAVVPSDGEPVRWADLADPGLTALEAAGMPDVETTVVRTGLADLDDALGGGMRAGQLVVVAGRTGIGKSVLVRNLVRSAAFDQKLTTVLFTLEMSDLEVFNAILSAELRIELGRINAGELSDNDWTRIARFLAETTEAPLFVDDQAGISLAEIRAKSRTIQKRHGLGLVVVDYLQLVDTPRSETRQVAVSALSRGFKILAQDLAVPVVVCAQLNRGPEMRADKRPQLADLRESGSIENDSNTVILVHRDDYYTKDTPRLGEADLIVAKQRGGRTGDVVVAAQLHHSRFASMAVE